MRLFSCLFALLLTPPAFAQPSAQALEARVSALEAKLATQASQPSPETEELTKMRMEMQLPEPLGARFTGLGPALSKPYFSRSPLSVGVIGEVTYIAIENGARSTSLARFNPLIGYRLSNTIVFNSGLSVQSGSTSRVEFAYVDFLSGAEAGLRVGRVLIPFGVTNLRFEPHLYSLVQRPRAETQIIPTTWAENGALAFGKVGSVMIQGGVVNGGDAAGYDQSSWIRGGRQSGSTAKASNPAFILRAEHLDDLTSLGFSLYAGNSSQGNEALGTAKAMLGEVHGEIRVDRLDGSLLLVAGNLSDTDRIATVTGQTLGSKVRGATLTLSYDLFPRFLMNRRRDLATFRELPLFFAWEHDNVYASPAQGAPENQDFRTNTYTFGFNFRPHPEVVFKASLANRVTPATSVRLAEAGLGFSF